MVLVIPLTNLTGADTTLPIFRNAFFSPLPILLKNPFPLLLLSARLLFLLARLLLLLARLLARLLLLLARLLHLLPHRLVATKPGEPLPKDFPTFNRFMFSIRKSGPSRGVS